MDANKTAVDPVQVDDVGVGSMNALQEIMSSDASDGKRCSVTFWITALGECVYAGPEVI
jgi:hypothetical protein